MSAVESESALEAEDVEQLPGFSVRFSVTGDGLWIADLADTDEFGSGDTIQAALDDLLLSMHDSREVLRARRPQLAGDLEQLLDYLESLPFLDAAVREASLHAVH